LLYPSSYIPAAKVKKLFFVHLFVKGLFAAKVGIFELCSPNTNQNAVLERGTGK
jgi:hypothetical membrane protein